MLAEFVSAVPAVPTRDVTAFEGKVRLMAFPEGRSELRVVVPSPRIVLNTAGT